MLLLLFTIVQAFVLTPSFNDFVMIPNALENTTWFAPSLVSPQTYQASTTVVIPDDNAVVQVFLQCADCSLFGFVISLGNVALPIFHGELDGCGTGCFVNRSFQPEDGSNLLFLTIQAPGNEQGWLKAFHIEISGEETSFWWIPTLIIIGIFSLLVIMAVLTYHFVRSPKRLFQELE